MKIKMTNKFWLVELEDELKQLSNGLTVKETRGKRDIVIGKVIHGDSVSSLSWFQSQSLK